MVFQRSLDLSEIGDVSGVACGEARLDIIELGPDWELYQTLAGMDVKLESSAGVPDSCPLLQDKRLRDVSSFTVCLACPKAIIKNDFPFYE